MPRHLARQDTTTIVVTPTVDGSIITSGTTVINVNPTGSNFDLNTSATGSLSFSQSIPPPSSTSHSAAAASTSAAVTVKQPIPVRTLVAICVAAFVLVAGLVLFVLWFGSRSRRNKNAVHEDVALNISKSTSGEDVVIKAIPPVNPGMTKGGYASEQSSYYSHQSTGRKPILAPVHTRMPTADSLDQHKLDLNLYSNSDEGSFMPKQSFYSRTDVAPVSPRSFTKPPALDPVNQSPRSTSAQAITRPYAIGAHPYASPGRGTPQSRPSIEHTGNYTVAVSYPDQDRPDSGHGPGSPGLGLSGHTFAGAGTRPGYNAYGIESRAPITSVNARPSLESIRSVARKASMDQAAVATATDFAMGGPTAVGTTRSRNNSTGSSHHRGVSGYGSSVYDSSIYGGGGSIKSGKAGKEKLSKVEKAREMKAMDHLIAALDENALRDKKRKEALAAAAGLGNMPSPTGSTRTREADKVDGSYPLPSADVFRAAFIPPPSATASVTKPHDDDWVDDEEIERWRRR